MFLVLLFFSRYWFDCAAVRGCRLQGGACSRLSRVSVQEAVFACVGRVFSGRSVRLACRVVPSPLSSLTCLRNTEVFH